MNDKTCRLCMKGLNGNEFDITEKVTGQMLDALLLKLNFDHDAENVMCPDCTRKLQSAVNFKTVCLNTENERLLFVNHEENNKSLNKTNNLNECTGISEHQKVCRFCKTATESGSYTYLQENKRYIFLLDMAQKYIPELNLCITEELVTCKICLNELLNFLNFTNDCLHKIAKINECKNEKDVDEQSNLNNIEDFTLKYELICTDDMVKLEEKYDAVKDEIRSEDNVEINNVGINLIHEKIEFKSEPNNCESFEDTPSLLECTAGNLHELTSYSYQSDTNRNTESDSSTTSITYCCEKCPYKTGNRYYFNRHVRKHQKPSKIKLYKCNLCAYTTKLQCNIKKHKHIHHRPLYSCEACPFQTIYKSNLTCHMLSHQNLVDKRVYKCGQCPFESTYKTSLKRHHRTHQLEINIHNCGQCTFQTKHKWSLKAHMVLHQDISEVTVYKCEKCSYQTKRQTSLKQHYVTHREPEFVCEECSYRTNDVRSLKRHQIIHQDMSEIKVYECERCSYKTRFKDNLKKHMLIHQDPLETEVFQCDKCLFQTKHRMNLKRHQLTHQELSEVTVYRCGTCSYSTRHKSGLSRHMLVHQDLSEVAVFECDTCSFKTKDKMSLKRHYLTHRDLSEITMYPCQTCSYSSIRKSGLKRHMRIHERK